MVRLADEDILTREVLDYEGLHLFHYPMSSCSQKLRIYLNLKNIAWHPHPINLAASENHEAWYLGVNPRGLVPALILDGAVHIESNDIIELLEARFPDPPLIPEGCEAEMTQLLKEEDRLHLDLRTLSFRFVYGRTGSPKPPEVMERFRHGGTGTVQGKVDPNKQAEIDFYDRLARNGITEDAIRSAGRNFRDTYGEFENRLASARYLFGDALSVLDIAWYVYTKRLSFAGYPFEALHPRVQSWFAGLDAQPEFSREVALPPQAEALYTRSQETQRSTGVTLRSIAGL